MWCVGDGMRGWGSVSNGMKCLRLAVPAFPTVTGIALEAPWTSAGLLRGQQMATQALGPKGSLPVGLSRLRVWLTVRYHTRLLLHPF